jgi:hypothetical protein
MLNFALKDSEGSLVGTGDSLQDGGRADSQRIKCSSQRQNRHSVHMGVAALGKKSIDLNLR